MNTKPTKPIVLAVKGGEARYHTATCKRVALVAAGTTVIDLATATRGDQYGDLSDTISVAGQAQCCKPSAAAWQAARDAYAATPAAPHLTPMVGRDDLWPAPAAAKPNPKKYNVGGKVTPAPSSKPAKAAQPANHDAVVGAFAATQDAARNGTLSFTVTDGVTEHTCRECGNTLPVSKFPTITDASHRSTRCRSCRDAGKK